MFHSYVVAGFSRPFAAWHGAEGRSELDQRQTLGVGSFLVGGFEMVTRFVFLFLVLAVPVFAHHGFDTEYDANKKVKLSGVVTQVAWTNPHMRVYVDVTGPDGKVTNWNLELTSPNTIRR
jgi:hypothetical protein